MVYESDFYTTRRPYSRPALSSYSVTSPVRFIPGVAKVHSLPLHYYGSPLIHNRVILSRPHSLYSSDLLPYTTVHSLPLYGSPLLHRSMVVSRPVSLHTPAPITYVVRTRPSVLDREFDRIQNRIRPSPAYRPVEDYLNSSTMTISYYTPGEIAQKRNIVSRAIYWYPSVSPHYVRDFDDETRKIRSQANSLMTRIHTPVHRPLKTIFFTTAGGYGSVYPSYPHLEDELAHIFSPISKAYSDSMPTFRKNIGGGNLACVRYAGDKAFSNRKSFYPDSDKVRNDVKLLSYYIQRRPEPLKALELASAKILCPYRPSRRFAQPKMLEDPKAELKEFKAARLERFNTENSKIKVLDDENDMLAKKKKQRQEEAKLAEEKAIKEEAAKRKEQAKREEAAKAAEAAKQEELAKLAAAEKAAEAERQKAEEDEKRKKQEEKAKKEAEQKAKKEAEQKAKEEAELKAKEEAELQAKEEAEKKAKEEAEQRAREEEEKRVREEEMKRLDEISRQAEEEKEAELARQADELAEIARQEAELAEQAKKEAEEEQARKEAEQAAAEEPAQAEESADAACEDVVEATPAESEEQLVEDTESAEVEAEPPEVAESESEASVEPSVEPSESAVSVDAPAEAEPVQSEEEEDE